MTQPERFESPDPNTGRARPAPAAAAPDAHVLVVDDEPDISALITYHLARERYRVRTAATGPEALWAVEVERPDLVVLDVILPGMNGLRVLEEIRRRPETEHLPVILLTALREERDRVAAFENGADDFLAKPFSPRELVLRVGAVLRRVRQAPPAAPGGRVMRVGPIVVDCAAARVECGGQPIDLTATELRLLISLVERRGRVQSRAQLLGSAGDPRVDLTTRAVDMHIQRLRHKLGAHAAWIETVRGFGYRFRQEFSSHEAPGA